MNVFYKFLALKEIPFNRRTARNFFATHPYHPGILSLSDLLDEFKTENAAVEVEEENLHLVPLPFIAKTSSKEGDFALVTALEGGTITYLNEKGKWPTTSLEQFKKQFTGVVLIAEKGPASGEANYAKQRQAQRYSSLVKTIWIALPVLLLGVLFATNTLPYAPAPSPLLFLLKFAGLCVSVLLLVQSFDAQNPLLRRLCSSSSGNGCNNVLSSAGSSLLGGRLSWSEVGFFYFGTTLISLAVNGAAGYSLLLWLNLVCLPYTFYSIGYQRYVARTWCRLCLAVQGILWLELITGILQPAAYRTMPGIKELMITAGIGASLVSLWLLIKPLIARSAQVDSLTQVANKFKQNEFVFHTLLQHEGQVDVPPAAPLLIGNPDARFEITIVSNPFCQPCRMAHQEIKKLLEACPDKLKVSVIFNATGNPSDPRDQVIHTLMSCYQQQGPHAFKALLDDWYAAERREVNDWLQQQRAAVPGAALQNQIKAQIEWCFFNRVSHTPALYINGYKAIAEYELADLKPFIMAS